MKIIRNLALGMAGAAIALFGVSLASSHAAPASAPADQEAFVNAAESTINGVVSVKNYATPRSQQQYGSGSMFGDPFFEYFFGGGQQRQQQQEQQKERLQGMGSGVILSKDGYIVTNNHVIDGAERLEVVLNDNQTFDAVVVGSDPDTDLALIKIEADNLHVIPMGNSDDLRVGEWVLAVGNPFGFTSTVTSGIVSAKARNLGDAQGGRNRVSGIESYIQTDAALNSGNSGGALVNLDGELVGINAAIYSQTGQYAGCSFAIPTSIVKKVVDDIKEYGKVQRAMLGITFAPLTPELIKEKNIKGVTAGIYVDGVVDQSAAKEAGLEQGDVLVSLNDAPTNNTAQIQEALAKCRPGQKVTMVYYRDGKRYEKSATLRNVSGGTELTAAGNVTDLGCTFSTVSRQLAQQLHISNGVQVRGIEDGPMKAAGVKENFIITSINNARITKPEDVEKIYTQIVDGNDPDKVMYLKGLYPTGKRGYYAVVLAED
ncbi:MAG: trypsin-like peptidase domain-containing protein [Bacteroidales bacterium]|nr:trypsin-like peptidase domain-containing protein [Bacteroidales bacterium]